MRKILLLTTLLAVFFSNINVVNGQTSIVLFEENFDTLTVVNGDTLPPWGEMIRYTINNPLSPISWNDTCKWDSTTRIASNASVASMWDTVGFGNIQYLESPWIYIDSGFSVSIQFDQICYIEQFDDARLQIKADTFPWRNTGPAGYEGTSILKGDSSFSKLSRPAMSEWRLADTTYTFDRSDVLAWARETFNITPYLNDYFAFQRDSVPVDSFKFRFALEDDPGSNLGRVGNHIWHLDNIEVRAAPCELIPPEIDLADPFNYIDKYEDKVYFQGPYDFTARILDNSTIDTAFIIYSVLRDVQGNGVYDTIINNDTVGMTFLGAGDFQGFLTPNVMEGDSVLWQITAIDASDCANKRSFPDGLQPQKFEVRGIIPKSCQSTPKLITNSTPYEESFNSIPTNQTGNLGQTDWVNALGDFHDWWVTEDSTYNALTGPYDDVTGGGKYLYLTADGFIKKTGVLLSPCFDLFEIRSGLMRFYANMNTRGGDTIHVDLFDADPTPGFPDGRFIEDVIPPISGNRGDEWIPIEISTYDFRQKVTQLRLRGVTNIFGSLGDMAVDSFSLRAAPVFDASVTNLFIPLYNPVGSPDIPEVTISNIGALPFDSFAVEYYVETFDPSTGLFAPLFNGGSTTYNININPGQAVKLAMPTPYTIPDGQYRVVGVVDLFNDEVPRNDTNFIRSEGLRKFSQRKFVDQFDTDTLWTTAPKFVGIDPFNNPTQNRWELGTPNFGTTNSAFSVPNSWDININNGYAGEGTIIQLISPFFDFSAYDSLLLNFMNNRFMTKETDGVWIDYSFDRGANWTDLPVDQDTNRIAWYNSNLSGGNFGGKPVFSEDTRPLARFRSGWIYSEIFLPDTFDFQPEILLRFNFFSEDRNNAGITGVGMSIDNFELYHVFQKDARVQRVTKPDTYCDLDTNLTVTAIFKNTGTDTIYDLPVEYTIRGPVSTQVKRDTIFGKIAPRDTIRYKSRRTFDFSAIGDYRVIAKTMLPGEECVDNDTASKFVENVDGCYATLELATTGVVATAPNDSNYWSFQYTNGNRSYEVTKAYYNYAPDAVIREPVCIKTGGSQVTFTLGDRGILLVERGISTWSLYAFDGDRDTTYILNGPGGAFAQAFDNSFVWDCPPPISANLLDIVVDAGLKRFPIPRDYNFLVKIENDGLDSLRQLGVSFQIDNQPRVDTLKTFFAPVFPDGLKWRRRTKVNFGDYYLSPGRHKLTAYTYEPNDSIDYLPENDTLVKYFTVLDTINKATFCESFEIPDTNDWAPMNAFTYRQDDPTWERGIPNPLNPTITSAYDSVSVWMTKLDTAFPAFDSSSVVSPFIYLEKDSCYHLTFYHNYIFDDIYHDGGHVQYSIDTGKTWQTVKVRDNLTDTTLEFNWYTNDFIASIPNEFGDIKSNQGFTGNSNGWIQSGNIIPAYESGYALIRWRMGSDGLDSSDGWAIDDVCINPVYSPGCYVTGIEGFTNEEQKFFLGQNIPNPTTDETVIPYFLPEAGNVNIVIVNLTGQIVYTESGFKAKGNHLLDFNTSSIPNGVYLYSIEYNQFKETKKMIIKR